MYKKIIFILSIFLILSCKSIENYSKINDENYHGYYKVGNPYQIEGIWYYPKEEIDYDEQGISSWYGVFTVKQQTEIFLINTP